MTSFEIKTAIWVFDFILLLALAYFCKNILFSDLSKYVPETVERLYKEGSVYSLLFLFSGSLIVSVVCLTLGALCIYEVIVVRQSVISLSHLTVMIIGFIGIGLYASRIFLFLIKEDC